MIDYYKCTKKDRIVKGLKDFEKGSWISVVDPSIKEIDYLVDKFKLDKQSLLCALNKNEIPWVHFENDRTYIMISIISNIEKHETETFLFVVSKDFVLTVSKTLPYIIRSVIEDKIRFITTENRWSVIHLLSKINIEFEKSIMDIEKNVNKMSQFTSSLKEKDVIKLLNYENCLNKFSSSYNHNIIVYNKLYRKAKISKEHRKMLEGVIAEYTEGFEMCKNSIKMISNLRNYYSILLSNKLNRTLTLFTVFTILISIPATIAALYGMNVILPMQDNSSMFVYIILIAICIWMIFLLYLKKTKMF